MDVDEDFQPEKNDDIIRILRENYGEDNVLNCATFKTESLKSAILTCARGLGYNNDDAQALAALVPSHRGKTYSLKDCLEGNEDDGLPPVENFKAKLEVYPGLFEAVQKIEGLPTNASIHASALYVFNNGYLAQNSLMKAPNKTKITAFNMHDSDDMGALKMDVLKTDAQSKMAKCMELMLKDNQIEWQGTLRQTYDKYLHPDVLDYNNPNMWKKMSDGSIPNLFQMDSPIGSIAMKKARPENVRQLAEVNSIMRLQSDSGEQPIDRYVRFRNDINQWYLEMADEGLNNEEISTLEPYLLSSNGVSGSQEILMRLLMEPKISGFTLGEANAARKAISKKIAAKIVQLKIDYFEKCKNLGTREVFSNYVWKYCIEPQLGYAFSLNHTLPYSIIAVQEANLATRWNPLYWQCACLCVNSGNYVGDMEEDEEELDTEDVLEDNEKTNDVKTKRVAPNYSKISKAISKMQETGVKIELPDINNAQEDFIPNTANNSIYYSLQAVNVVSDDLLESIIANRPYTSIEDFYNKVKPTISQIVGLAKSGCFDKLYNKPRKAVLDITLDFLASLEIEKKSKLTNTQLKKAIELKMPELKQYIDEVRIFNFKQYIDKNCLDATTKRYILTEESCIKFFNLFLKEHLNIAKDEYGVLPNNALFVKQSSLKKICDSLCLPVLEWLNTEQGLDAYTRILREDYKKQLMDKYCQGNESTWEFSTMCYYYSGHELKDMNNTLYNTQNFNDQPDIPKNNALYSIAGTVIGTDNTKHIVSLLTIYGVVDVKFYAPHYNRYNQRISVIDSKTKKKKVVDESWFKRGTKILVYGQRYENMFRAKNYRENGYQRLVCLIEQVNSDGSLELRFSRKEK